MIWKASLVPNRKDSLRDGVNLLEKAIRYISVQVIMKAKNDELLERK